MSKEFFGALVGGFVGSILANAVYDTIKEKMQTAAQSVAEQKYYVTKTFDASGVQVTQYMQQDGSWGAIDTAGQFVKSTADDAVGFFIATGQTGVFKKEPITTTVQGYGYYY